MDEASLRDWLAVAAGDPGLSITAMARLSGGAIQQNWALDVMLRGAERRWVLRTDSAATLAVSHSRAEEFALLRAAEDAGVTVPAALYLCEDEAVLGRPFFVMRRVEGVAAAHRLVRMFDAATGDVVVAALGRDLAHIHRITPPRDDLHFLGAPPEDAAVAGIAALRARLDAAGTPRPILEWGLRALERCAPTPLPPVLCHNDFRTGNLMLAGSRLSAVLALRAGGAGGGWNRLACCVPRRLQG